jgi:hypothetical protein
LVEDQVTTETLPDVMLAGLAEIVTVGGAGVCEIGVDVGVGVTIA